MAMSEGDQGTGQCPKTGENVCYCSDLSDLSGDHAEHMAALDLVKPSDASHIAVQSGSWFDPQTWASGTVPGDDATVFIPQTMIVSYDGESDARIKTVGIGGALSFSHEVSSKLVVDTLVVAPKGRLEIGSADQPIGDGVTVDIVIADNGDIDTAWDPQLLSRGIVSLGEVEMHGAEKVSHLKVTEDPMAGDTSLTLAAVPEGWAAGDTIVIAGTQNDGWGWDGSKNAFRGDTNEVVTILSIDGQTILFDPPLEHDHPSPRGDLKTSVANYTRSITIASESNADSAVHHRGHVMFMGSDDVDVRFVAFDELGRTDKSERSVSASSIPDGEITADDNVQGRYGIHLHRLGTTDQDNPVVLEGNAVFGSPGWGIAHHSSNAILHQNATFDTHGAGFVAEKGDETGVWSQNIAIGAEGEQRLEKDAADVQAFDLARTGNGFWFQGRMVEAHDNIAAATRTGYVWMTRGDTAPIDPDLFDQPEALGEGRTSGANIPVINNFTGNEALGSETGLKVIKANPNQGHDLRTVMEDFTAWEVRQGAHFEYTSHYTLHDFDVVGLQNPPRFTRSDEGISFGTNVTDMVIANARVDGFNYGYDLAGNFTSGAVPSGRDATAVNQYVIVGGELLNINKTDVKQADPDSSSHTNRWPEFVTFLDPEDLEGTPPVLSVEVDPLTVSATNGMREAVITGTKTDSLGTIPIPAGTDTYKIDYHDVVRIVQEEGYFTRDGKEAFVAEAYYQDRFTGEILKQGYIVEASAGVLSNQYGVFRAEIFLGEYPEGNRAPIALGETAQTGFERAVTIDVLANDRDEDGDTIRVDGLVQPEHGWVSDQGDGTILYRPDFGFSGEDIFHYWVTDGYGEFVKASVTVTVAEENAGEPLVYMGSFSHDRRDGTAHDDQLTGRSGLDLLNGFGGNDTLYGDYRNFFDQVDNPWESDTLDGGAGDDFLVGGDLGDLLIGGTGNDEIHGDLTNRYDLTRFDAGQPGADPDDDRNGDDTIEAGAGDDRAGGGGGDDLINGGNGNDFLVGGLLTRTYFYAGDGDDTLNGGEGNDTLVGGGGDDLIDGGAGVNTAGYLGNLLTPDGTLNYQFILDGEDLQVRSGFFGNDSIRNVDFLVFKDGTITYEQAVGFAETPSVDFGGLSSDAVFTQPDNPVLADLFEEPVAG